MTYEEKLLNCKQRILALYPTASILQGIDSTGNFVYRVIIPGVKVIESPNVSALEIITSNLEMTKKD